jgi:hypothetical protein
MQRLVPAILAAWREAERGLEDESDGPTRQALAARIHVLQEAHVLGTTEPVDRATVVRFLKDHGLGDVVTEPAD